MRGRTSYVLWSVFNFAAIGFDSFFAGYEFAHGHLWWGLFFTAGTGAMIWLQWGNWKFRQLGKAAERERERGF